MERWTSDLTILSDWLWVGSAVAPLGLLGGLLLLVGGPEPAGRVWYRPEAVLARFSRGLERVFGIAAPTSVLVGTGLWGTMVSGLGLRWDLGWHVAHGRDATLVPPHVVAGVGTVLIQLGVVLSILLATQRRDPGCWRWSGLRIPPAAGLAGILSVAASSGLLIDDGWHRLLGKDASVWSPPHLIMLVSGAFIPLALVLPLRRPQEHARPVVARAAALLCFVAALAALSSLQSEFATGGPRALHLQHPVLIGLAAGAILPAARWVVGRGGALMTVVVLGAFNFAPFVPPLDMHGPREALYVGAAVAVELLAGRAPARWSRVAAVGATTGVSAFAVEYVWSQGGYQPWQPSLVVPGVLACALAAAGAATLSAGCWRRTGAIDLPAQSRGKGVLAFTVVVTLTLLPLIRLDREVPVHMTAGGGRYAHVALDFEDDSVVSDANWFQVSGFGAGFFLSGFEKVDGRWVSEDPVPLHGNWRTVVRLHVGTSLLLIPLHFPYDDATGVGPIDNREFRGPLPSEGSPEILQLSGLPGPVPLTLGYLAVAGMAAAWSWLLGRAATAIGHGAHASEPALHDVRVPAPQLLQNSVGADRTKVRTAP
jgi:hypothetical protein